MRIPNPESRIPSASAHEIDDLDLVALTHGRAVVRFALEHHQIVLHRDAAGIDLQLRQKLAHRQGTRDLVRIAVQRYLQFPLPF